LFVWFDYVLRVLEWPPEFGQTLACGIYPGRRCGLTIDRPNQVWVTTISYVPLARGVMHLVAVMG